MNNFTRIQGVQALALVEVPQHGGIVLSSTGGQRAIRGDTDGIQVSGVSDKVVAEFTVGEVPDLDEAIPTSGDNERDRLRGREAYARDPLAVTLGVSTDGVLAFTEGVPETNRFVTRACVEGREEEEKHVIVRNGIRTP